MDVARPHPPRVERQAPPDLAALPLDAVCRYVERRHHRYLRRRLPRLSALAARVEGMHLDRDHRLEELRNVFERLRAEMEAHMAKEERLLFPACRELAQGRPASLLEAPVAMLEREHAETRAALARLRRLTDGFDARGIGCEAHRALVVGLAALAEDTERHIAIEQRALFPRIRGPGSG